MNSEECWQRIEKAFARIAESQARHDEEMAELRELHAKLEKSMDWFRRGDRPSGEK